MSNTEEYIYDAKKAAVIVATGIVNQDYADINRQLEELSISNDARDAFVFKKEKSIFIRVIIICLAILTAGFIYYDVLGIHMIFFSKEFFLQAIIAVVVSTLLLTADVFLIVKCMQLIKFYKRYEIYYEMLRYKNIELVYDIVSFSKIKEEVLLKDLNRAIKMKYIPQGHFGTDNLVFIVSNDIYEKYIEKQAIYDRYYKKQLEERIRISDRTDKIQEILDIGQKYVDDIHKSNDIIKDKKISDKLDIMERIVKMIFLELDNQPQHAERLGLFLDYYLPTTLKLLEAYIEADEKPIEGRTINDVKKEIESSLDTINDSFEGILDKFYQEQEIDVVSDISALESMMEQEEIPHVNEMEEITGETNS